MEDNNGADAMSGGLVFPSDAAVWDSANPRKWLVSDKDTIYVRPCYADVWALCQRAWDSDVPGIFLKGSPGIGKSYFLDCHGQTIAEKE